MQRLIRQRETLSVASLVLAAGLSCAFGLVIGTSGSSKVPVAVVLGLAAIAFGIWAIQRPLGICCILIPVFWIYQPPQRFGMDAVAESALIVVATTAAWWRLGGARPAISGWAVLAFAVPAVWAVGAAFYGTTLDLQRGIAFPTLWIAGLVVGSCLAARPEALLGLALVVVPSGLLSIAEAAGVHNYWADITKASQYEVLAHRVGAARSISTFAHPLIAGGVLAASALLLLSSKKPWALVAAAVCLAGSVATVSRSAMLGLLAAAAVIAWYERNRLSRVVLGLALTGTVLAAIVLFVPSVRESFDSRVTNNQDQQVIRRTAAEQTLKAVVDDPASVAVGRGVGASSELLIAQGSLFGFTVLDDQYATGVYDFGLVPLALAFVCGMLALRRAASVNRRAAVPALVLLLVVMAFTDGLYWSSFGLLFGVVLGWSTALPKSPPVANDSSARAQRSMSASHTQIASTGS